MVELFFDNNKSKGGELRCIVQIKKYLNSIRYLEKP